MVKCEFSKGTRFGKLTLTGQSELRGKRRYVECECDCGNVKWVRLDGLNRGNCISCGCAVAERLKRDKPASTHGLSSHPLYTVWKRMNERCYDERHKSYHNYGGRSVTVIESWRTNFINFFEWAKDKWQEGLELDKDILYKEKHNAERGMIYSPEYCQFVTGKVNCRNTSQTRYITFNGESKSLVEWAEKIGISDKALGERLNRYGWSVEDALTNNEKGRNKTNNRWIEAFGEKKCLVDWGKDERCLVTSITLAKRLGRGWDAERAITTPSDIKYNDFKNTVNEKARE